MLATRIGLPFGLLMALVLLTWGSPEPLAAGSCNNASEALCQTDRSCVKFDLIVWEYNHCTTRYQHGDAEIDCRVCHIE